MPYSTIEPLRGKLVTGFQSTRLEVDTGVARRMEVSVKQTVANLSVQLAAGTIRTKEFLALQPGDVMTLDKTPTEEAVVLIEGTPKYYGYVGNFRGNRAIRVTRPIPKKDLVNFRNKEEALKHGR